MNDATTLYHVTAILLQLWYVPYETLIISEQNVVIIVM